MSAQDPLPTRSQLLRLRLFRVSAAFLLILSVLGFLSLCAGVYFTIQEHPQSGWFSPLLLCALALSVGLVVLVCMRALRIKSIADLEKQNESKWLRFLGASSPNKSLERTREG
jgi:peptidoglycan/LPS O-acetylase OafA/YrhL